MELASEQVPLAESFAPLAHLRGSDLRLIEVNHGSRWLGTAMAPVTQLLLVIVVGERSLAVAQAGVQQVKQRLAGEAVPVFLTEGLAHYKTASLTGGFNRPLETKWRVSTKKPKNNEPC